MNTATKKHFARITDYARTFKDVRVLGMVLFAFAVLLMSWSAVKVIETNYRLQKQINELEQQNSVASLATKNQKLKNQYYQSSQYLDIAAREHFGLAAPGETVLAVPQSVALAQLMPVSEDVVVQADKKAAAKRPTYQRNLQAWMDFLLHRQQSP